MTTNKLEFGGLHGAHIIEFEPDYTKTCWYCGSKRVIKAGSEMYHSWFHCTKCGATYTELPKVEAATEGVNYG
jgi:transposase-like protein